MDLYIQQAKNVEQELGRLYPAHNDILEIIVRNIKKELENYKMSLR